MEEEDDDDDDASGDDDEDDGCAGEDDQITDSFGVTVQFSSGWVRDEDDDEMTMMTTSGRGWVSMGDRCARAQARSAQDDDQPEWRR